MRLPTSFDPIEPGETDNFAFDFTPDVGAAAIVSTAWICALAPYQTAVDPVPSARVLSFGIENQLLIRDPLSGVLNVKAGAFSVALIGGMPASAAGATYILEATATLSDGRVLNLSSTVLCSSTASTG